MRVVRSRKEMKKCFRTTIYCTLTLSVISTFICVFVTTRKFYFYPGEDDEIGAGHSVGVYALQLLNGTRIGGKARSWNGTKGSPAPGSQPTSPPKPLTLKIPWRKVSVVGRGENIQAGDRQVHITTAVYYRDFPVSPGFNVFLNGWARHNDSMDFKCCFLHSLPNPSSSKQDVGLTEVDAKTYNVYRQWIVDMQNAEFSCSIPGNMSESSHRYVTFVKHSCREEAWVNVTRIELPERAPRSVGVCLKVTYGKIDPEKMVEWFEFMKLMKVTRVFTYYFDVNPEVFKVLTHYNQTGFLDLLLIHPAKSKNGKDRGFRHPRYSEQAFVDEVMAANDCKHRMSKFDFVVIMDIDEYIVPKGNLTTYYDLFKLTANRFPQSGAFQIDAHVIMTSWGVSRNSPLHLTRHVNRTLEANYDGAFRNTRWAFQPQRTFYARNNYVYTRKGFNVIVLPHEYFVLLHYRACKRQWTTCNTSTRVHDEIMVKYESRMIENIAKLPLKTILYKNGAYAKNITDWYATHKPHKT